MGKKLIKNSQPFGEKCQKTAGGDFFDSHCIGRKLLALDTYHLVLVAYRYAIWHLALNNKLFFIFLVTSDDIYIITKHPVEDFCQNFLQFLWSS